MEHLHHAADADDVVMHVGVDRPVPWPDDDGAGADHAGAGVRWADEGHGPPSPDAAAREVTVRSPRTSKASSSARSAVPVHHHSRLPDYGDDTDDDDHDEAANRPLLQRGSPFNASSARSKRRPPPSPLSISTGSSQQESTCLDKVWRLTHKWRVELIIWMLLLMAIAIVVAAVVVKSNKEITAQDRACRVYCTGPILAAVARFSPYADSKTFVDMPMKQDPLDVLKAFKQIEPGLTRNALESFLDTYFLPAGSDQSSWTPPDFPAKVPFAHRIANTTLREWIQHVHEIWPLLGRKTNASVSASPSQHSLLELPNPYIVPGGRFREMYYWDMFWVVRGLIRSGMVATAIDITRNYFSLIDRFGFVPNGARVYYLTRSQPPVLNEIVMSIYNATGNSTFLLEAYPYLSKEYKYWNSTTTHKRVNIGLGLTAAPLTRYYADTQSPRPESYREDENTANVAGFDEQQRQIFFRNIASGAETGWDFSSRWLKDASDLSTIRTTNIVPVDLNCFMLRFERHLASIATLAGDRGKASTLSRSADARARAMLDLMYNETTGRFHDILLPNGDQIQGRVTPAAYLPLWAGVSPSQELHMRLVESLTQSRLLKHAAVDTTLSTTGQQWDSPNAWAPLQWLLVRSLESVHTSDATKLATSIKCKWLKTAMIAYHNSGHMYEKYDAVVVGKGGGGGEYKPQLGFGWTNGVVLDFAAELAATFDTACAHVA
ncbi:hypothetical protein PTSG_07040 [Salpingoeca rosetta]|uniref:Trehalase n=1 Tax=Salpingoeca rosetta (strain ATCC 50818 / BSB-021) TaxID=946362 RepID=F2UDV7_SALR5|nr:uncharacterized protein PTSG_07040 [Salpingoeca rosetta]EGD74807.1 hypothetical protein PTSG_07040 [Salpingoeca rosetta]|eukprot:XP_004992452.1 hypothetical protein PTSG_07040 [Salpingoeca rosetta]